MWPGRPAEALGKPIRQLVNQRAVRWSKTAVLFMNTVIWRILTLALFLTAGCGASNSSPASDGTWVGTISTEGNVTTVVNESGSVWGGTATLVEEASIGVDAGADEYMLGEVSGIAATPDNIFVIDRQIPAVRVYDAHGVYQRDIGGPGQGPGEFQRPASIAIGTNGQIFLRDDGARRIWVYSQDGDYLHAYPMTGGINTSRPMALLVNDVPYTTVFVGLRTDAGSLLEVERSAALVAVDPDEAAWHRANATAIMRDIIPGWIWNGPEVADTKPLFHEFIPSATGEIWVRRPGRGTPLPGCNQAAESSAEFSGDPCWAEQNLVDVFGNDGRYLGAVDAPAEMQFSPRPVIAGYNVVARTEDEAGTIMVKRYRLVLPGER